MAGYLEAGLLLELGLATEEEGEAAEPFSKMEILSLMPLLGAGEVMVVLLLLFHSTSKVVFLRTRLFHSFSILIHLS